jgi:conjugative transfer region lipoprotein (TIGR03751 family)
MRMHYRVLGLVASTSALLGGCASTKDSVLPQDGPAMQAIYEQHMSGLGQQSPQALRGGLGDRAIVSGDVALEGYTRDAAHEIDNLFPRLPNPTLVMYVFPHLSHEERVPVPGYATAFPMYERVEYALPGEVPGRP